MKKKNYPASSDKNSLDSDDSLAALRKRAEEMLKDRIDRLDEL